MSQYRSGTVSVTNGSTTVTGDITAFTTNVVAGDLFTVVNDGVTYQVASVTSDTVLVLNAAYAGTTGTGKSYTIARDFTPNFNIPYIQKNDIETATILKAALTAIDTELKANDFVGTANQIVITPELTGAVVSLAPNIVIPAPASGTSLFVSGASTGSSPTVQIGGTSVVGGRALSVYGGAAAGDYPFIVGNAAQTKNYFIIEGDGSSYLGPSASVYGLAVNASGNVTINTPSSGTPLTVSNGALGGVGISVTGSATSLIEINDSSESVFRAVTNTKTGDFYTDTVGVHLRALSNDLLDFATNNTQRMTIAAAGNVSINAPTSGKNLLVYGSASNPPSIYVQAGSGAGAGNNRAYLQLVSQAGTTGWNLIDVGDSSDEFVLQTLSGTNVLTATQAGNVTINAPTSGTTLTVAAASGAFAADFQSATSGADIVRFTGNNSVGNGDYVQFYDGNASAVRGYIGWGANVLGTLPVTDMGFVANNGLHLISGGNHDALDINTAGNVTINAPGSGIALTANGGTGNATILASSTGAAGSLSMGWNVGIGSGWNIYTSSTDTIYLGTVGTGSLELVTAGAGRINIANAGNITMGSPTSGTTLNVSNTTGASCVSWGNGTQAGSLYTYGGYVVMGAVSGAPLYIVTGPGNIAATVTAAGNWSLTAPTSGVGLAVNGVSGTHSTQIADSANNKFNAGFLECPVNNQAGNYTFVLSDSGKFIVSTATSGTPAFTIPASASVAFPVGTSIVLMTGSQSITLGITTDILAWIQGGSYSTGTRTIAARSMITFIKYQSNAWALSGNGIS